MNSARRLIPSILLALLATLLVWADLRFRIESIFAGLTVFFVILATSYIVLRFRDKASHYSGSAATKPVPPTELESEKIDIGTGIAREADVQVDQLQEEVVSGAELVGFKKKEVNEGTVQVIQQTRVNRGAIVGARIDRLGKDHSTEKTEQN